MQKNIPSNASTSPGPLVPENILILLYFSVSNELVDNWMDRLVWTMRDGEEMRMKEQSVVVGGDGGSGGEYVSVGRGTTQSKWGTDSTEGYE